MMKTKLLLLLLLAALNWASSWSAGVGRCGDLMTGCTCQTKVSGDERDVQCMEEGVEIRATVKLGKEIIIECSFNTSTPRHFEMLAGFNAGPVSFVQISYCPMPLTPLNQLLDKITGGPYLNQTKRLVIQSHGVALDLREHFLGFTGLTSFEMSSNIIHDVPDDLLQSMKNLTRLDLRHNGIRKLPPKFLQYTPRLSILELGYNEISEIPNDLFFNVTDLTYLNLWLNKFSTLNQSSFIALNKLENLDLSSNGLQNLPNDIFHNLTRLKDINLSSNNFSSLPAELLKNLRNLTRLRLTDNKLSILQLPDGFFANLPNLRELVLSRSGINQLPKGLLQETSELTNLTIANNKLTTLSGSIFADTKKLILLDMSSNSLTELPDDTFMGLGQLRVLKMANNRMTKISDGLLQPLVMLQDLDISRNHLFVVEASAFNHVQNLRVLKLNNNQLSFNKVTRDAFGVYSPLHMCTLLEEIDLSNNTITEIASDWRLTMLKLRSLDLSYNNISSVEVQDLHFLSGTLTVDLRHNSITEVNMDYAEILALHQASVSEPDRTDVSRSVRVLLGHNPLDCSNCDNYPLLRYREERMSRAVNNLVKLDTSDLNCSNGTPLKWLSSLNFTCPTKECSKHCECSIQPDRFALLLRCCSIPNKLPQLRRINRTELLAEECKLQLAPNVREIEGNDRLTAVLLGNNNVTELRVRTIPKRLEVLELHNNNLSRLSESVLQHLKNSSNLTRLTLSGNPWQCDCEAKDLLAYVQAHFMLVADMANVSCSDGRFLRELTTNDLCTSPATVALSIIVAITGLLLGVATAIYYRYQHEIKVWLYARNLCLWFVKEDELDKDKKYDAFVSYSHKDEAFVAEHLVPRLEPPFKLCIHVRDWVVGDWIPEQIAKSVQNSRRTLVVLSPSFIESVWGRLEFRAAHQQAISEGRVRVIVILLEDVGDINKLDPELRAYLTMNTYLQWGDPWFWDKLRYALPHTHNIEEQNGDWGRRRRRVENSGVIHIKDKLEIIRTNVIVSPPSHSPNTPPAAVNGHTEPTA